MKPIHHRMPVILPEKAEDLWLDPKINNIPTLRSLLRPYPEDEMEAYEVSTFVNSPRNNTPQCIAPVGETPQAQLEALPLIPMQPSKGFLEKAKKIREEKRK